MDSALLSSYYPIQVEESIHLEEVLVGGLFSEVCIFLHMFITVVHRCDVTKHVKISRVFRMFSAVLIVY